MGFYLIPGLSKSDHYFSRNRPESKFGQFHKLTLDAMDHILCLRRQYQKIVTDSSITKKKYFAHHFGGYDVINERTLFMHLMKLTKFTLGLIARKVMIRSSHHWYQINSHEFLLLLSYDT